MTHPVLNRAILNCIIVAGLLGHSLDAFAAPVYLECRTADVKGKKMKTMTLTLDEAAQTVSGALGVMDGAFAGPSPEAERNMSAVSGVLGSEQSQSSGVNLRTPQTRKAIFAPDHVEFSLFQTTGGEAMAVAIRISRIDLTIIEKYPLMKARNGMCKVLEVANRAF